MIVMIIIILMYNINMCGNINNIIDNVCNVYVIILIIILM